MDTRYTQDYICVERGKTTAIIVIHVLIILP